MILLLATSLALAAEPQVGPTESEAVLRHVRMGWTGMAVSGPGTVMATVGTAYAFRAGPVAAPIALSGFALMNGGQVTSLASLAAANRRLDASGIHMNRATQHVGIAMSTLGMAMSLGGGIGFFTGTADRTSMAIGLTGNFIQLVAWVPIGIGLGQAQARARSLSVAPSFDPSTGSAGVSGRWQF